MDKKAILIGAGVAVVIYLAMLTIEPITIEHNLPQGINFLLFFVGIGTAWYFGRWWGLLGFFGALFILIIFVPMYRFDLILGLLR